jgi:putative modified peptide
MAKNNVTPEQLDEILHRLSTDDSYREHFLGNPVSALAQHGVEVHPDDVPTVRSLPSKETLTNDREAIKSQIGNSASAMFFVTSA